MRRRPAKALPARVQGSSPWSTAIHYNPFVPSYAQERYRCPDGFQTGCRQCGVELPRHLAYCSETCMKEFDANHFWRAARPAAIKASQPFGPALECTWGHYGYRAWRGSTFCAKCGREHADEVHHKMPMNGQRDTFSCLHHQENLEVLCHACHVAATREQRRLGLIGRSK